MNGNQTGDLWLWLTAAHLPSCFFQVERNTANSPVHPTFRSDLSEDEDEDDFEDFQSGSQVWILPTDALLAYFLRLAPRPIPLRVHGTMLIRVPSGRIFDANYSGATAGQTEPLWVSDGEKMPE